VGLDFRSSAVAKYSILMVWAVARMLFKGVSLLLFLQANSASTVMVLVLDGRCCILFLCLELLRHGFSYFVCFLFVCLFVFQFKMRRGYSLFF